MLGCYNEPILGNCPIQSTCWVVFMFTHCQCWGYWWSQENLAIVCSWHQLWLSEHSGLFSTLPLAPPPSLLPRHYVGQSKAEIWGPLNIVLRSSKQTQDIYTPASTFTPSNFTRRSAIQTFCSLPWRDVSRAGCSSTLRRFCKTVASRLLLFLVCCQDWYTYNTKIYVDLKLCKC